MVIEEFRKAIEKEVEATQKGVPKSRSPPPIPKIFLKKT